MNGFISESTSKISDGFGTAFYILVLYFSTRLIYPFVESTFGKPGVFIYILILLAAGIIMLARALLTSRQDAQLADAGLTAGVLLWQVTQFSNLLGSSGLFEPVGWLFWLMVVLITTVLWRKVLPIGLRFFMLVYLLWWAGLLYANSLILITAWPPAFIASYHALRVTALLGVLFFLWWIVFRTFNPVQRKVCAVGLAFCVLLGLLNF
jgi:hypothetical protein